MSTDHQHMNHTSLGAGILIVGTHELPFVNSSVFLKMLDLGDEQRICVSFDDKISLNKLITVGEPFIQIKLSKPFYAPGRNIPVQKLPLFLLSGKMEGNQIDFLISPRIKLLDDFLGRHLV